MTYNTTYLLALAIMDEVLASGAVDESATAEYKARSPGILTILQAEMFPSTGVVVTPVSALTDVSVLSDYLTASVLPYGLAAHLLLAENPSAAAFFQQRYEELRVRIPVTPTAIVDVYGGV